MTEKFDGYGMPITIKDEKKAKQSLEDIYQLILAVGRRETCMCGEPLRNTIIWSWDHPDGKFLAGFGAPQWVFLHCNKCGYDYAIWKLLTVRDYIDLQKEE